MTFFNQLCSRDHFNISYFPSSTGVKEVALIPLHASPEFAVEEIHELVEVHKDVVERWGITNVIILGDLNADCNYVRASDWPNIALRSDKQYDWRTADDEDTTVSTTDCAYDRYVSEWLGYNVLLIIHVYLLID